MATKEDMLEEIDFLAQLTFNASQGLNSKDVPAESMASYLRLQADKANSTEDFGMIADLLNSGASLIEGALVADRRLFVLDVYKLACNTIAHALRPVCSWADKDN